jgi:hypothetical protein
MSTEQGTKVHVACVSCTMNACTQVTIMWGYLLILPDTIAGRVHQS